MHLDQTTSALTLLTSQQVFVLAASILLTSTALYDKLKLPQQRPIRMAAIGMVLFLLSTSYLAGSDFNPFIYFRF